MIPISEIHIFHLDLPVVDGPYRIASSEVWSLKTTIVKIVCANGLVGWGETCPVGPTYSETHSAGALAALTEMAAGLIGAPLDPVPLHHRMNRLLNGHNYAKAAIDIAAHDALGKHYGVSVATLLGGALTDRVASYYATGVGQPDDIARIAAAKVAEGYPRLQVKVGNRPVEIDIETIRKVWEAIRGTGTRLAMDGNRSLNTRDVLRISRECPDIPFILEQPCNSIAELRQIRPQINHGIYMD